MSVILALQRLSGRAWSWLSGGDVEKVPGVGNVGSTTLTVTGDYAFRDHSFQPISYFSSVERRHGFKKGP